MQRSIIITLILASIALILGARSSRWPSVQKSYLKSHAKCEVCGTNKNLSVHHIKPYHLFPELELDSNNLMTVDDKCHWNVCHSQTSWKAYNPNCKQDAKELNVIYKRIKENAKY